MRALGLLLLLTVAQASHASAERYIQLSMHVVKVLAANADGRINTGTGVQIDDTHVITNCHVVGIATNVIVARGSSGVPAQASSVDPRHDLCVMTTPHAMGRPVDMATSRTLKVGDTVHAVGFSGGKALSMSDGQVTALHEMDGALVIETDASFQQGASGGALFDTDRGNPELMRVMDRINAQWGRGTMRLAAEGVRQGWRMRRGMMSPCYTTRWAELPAVR